MIQPELRIAELEAETDSIVVVHYSCESFYEVKDRPTGIACITFVNYPNRDSVTFSLTDVQGEDAELTLLRGYFDHLKRRADARYVHWNMNSSEFGFRAIEKRYKYLTGDDPPVLVSQERLFDLDDLITFRHGEGFADHPKFKNLVLLNGLSQRHMLGGADEAEKYQRGEFGDLNRSTLEKAQLLAHLCKRFLGGELETKSGGRRLGFAGVFVDSIRALVQVGARFRLVTRQLRNRKHSNEPPLLIENEWDAQYLFCALLRLLFDDVRPEEWTPNYAGSNKRIDFLIPNYGIAVELKFSRPSMGKKELGDELVIDQEHYTKHNGVRHLVALVFDEAGHIENPRGLENDLSGQHGQMAVTVRIFD